MAFSKFCTSFGLERPVTLWANCMLPSGGTRYSTLDLSRCLHVGPRIGETDVSPGGFGNGEDNDSLRKLRLEGTVLKADVKWSTGWLFWQKDVWNEAALDLDLSVRVNNGVLEYVLFVPFWKWLTGYKPRYPGVGGPPINIILDADRARQEEEYKKREEARLKNTYREGAFRVWKGT
ncbi:hypothetical protein B0F90DRAFT_1669666 [Multifurca ochricompacta]|uniref:Cyanovirin-N domain-containing protein n=1 Tax=Multifurca ochricompacta TaxID=376703 RepID=A0AAD4QLJ3_9AGAM|nr:hypothetical protein B0F90DRAFT_1669666 [Multifurca ochricompacta]